jgi:hypothetical protein
MSFWNGVTGKAEDAFVQQITLIPNNTTAPAIIKTLHIAETSDQYQGQQKFIEITWKLASGDFKGCEVKQKIKCFIGEEKQLTRARNMLKLLLNICNYTLSHDGEPVTADLLPLTGRVVGVKVREWQIEKKDGSGVIEGNFVAELWPVDDKFVTETGLKLAPKAPKPMPQYSQSIPNIADDNGDIPF